MIYTWWVFHMYGIGYGRVTFLEYESWFDNEEHVKSNGNIVGKSWTYAAYDEQSETVT